MAVVKKIDLDAELPNERGELLKLKRHFKPVIVSMKAQIDEFARMPAPAKKDWHHKLSIAYRLHVQFMAKIDAKLDEVKESNLADIFMDEARSYLDPEDYWNIMDAAREASAKLQDRNP